MKTVEATRDSTRTCHLFGQHKSASNVNKGQRSYHSRCALLATLTTFRFLDKESLLILGVILRTPSFELRVAN